MGIEKYSKLFLVFKANRTLMKKIIKLSERNDDSLLEYANNYNELSIDELKLYLEDTKEIKKVLESKSQYSLIAISVSTSLIVGLSSTILKMSYSSDLSRVFGQVITFFSFAAVLYLIIAGILSLICIGDYNVIYKISPVELKSSSLKRMLSFDIELNNNYNSIRNNLMNTSYSCIKKSLISLGLLFICIILLNGINYQSNEFASSKIDMEVAAQKDIIININNELTEIENLLQCIESKLEIQNSKIITLQESYASEKEITTILSEMNRELENIKELFEFTLSEYGKNTH